MSTHEDEIPSPARAGSGLDLARRMDRMEQRHEDLAKEVSSLSSVVARVEQNQEHSVELAKLRFSALDTGLASLTAQLSAFQGRVEAIISGEVQTVQTRQGQELVADYQKWRGTVDAFMDAQALRDAKEAGIFATFGIQKTFLLAMAAVLSPVVAIVALVLGK